MQTLQDVGAGACDFALQSEAADLPRSGRGALQPFVASLTKFVHSRRPSSCSSTGCSGSATRATATPCGGRASSTFASRSVLHHVQESPAHCCVIDPSSSSCSWPFRRSTPRTALNSTPSSLVPRAARPWFALPVIASHSGCLFVRTALFLGTARMLSDYYTVRVFICAFWCSAGCITGAGCDLARRPLPCAFDSAASRAAERGDDCDAGRGGRHARRVPDSRVLRPRPHGQVSTPAS